MKKTFTLLFTLLIFAQAWASTGSWTSGSASVALDDNGTITITGEAMKNYEAKYDPNVDQEDKRPEWIKLGYGPEIKKVVANSSVTRIGSNAFRECPNIASVELNNPDLIIGHSAFWWCTNLTSVTIPENTTEINSGAFGRTGLTDITIPALVNKIYGYAFYNCPLTFIRCKAEVPPTIADATAFEFVSRDIPVYVPFSSVDAYKAADVWKEFTNILPDPEQCPAYGYCGLQGDNVTWSLDCEGVLIISGTGAMASYSTDSYAPWNFQAKDVKTIVVEEGVKTIGGYAFYNCKNATSVTLPNSLLSIGRNAFNICQKITSIVIPSSVANIGQYAFSACSALASVRLLGCPTIETGAFQRCHALTSVLCASEIPPVCSQSQNPFTFISDEELGAVQLSVPGKAVSDYQAHEIWSKFNIQASDKKKIQFVDEAGQVLKTAMLDEGTMPNADELTPTKAEDEDYTYEFAGWLPALHEVKEDYIYVTQFVRTPKKFFHVTIGGENCSLEVLNKVPEGTFLEVKVNPNECLQFQKWSDDNTDNPRIIEVTNDMNVSAELNKITYTVTDNSQNGHLNIAPQQ